MRPSQTRSGRLPDWLVRRLEAAGVIDSATGATRSARTAKCPVCQARVMRGLDADFGSMSADCDPEPLAPLGEALALMAGRRTYVLRWRGNRYELDQRDQFSIRGAPAGSKAGQDVLAGHVCGGPELPTTRTRLVDQLWSTHAALPEEPPF